MKYKCDIKIMAVKPRRHMVLDMLNQMGLEEKDTVIYDDRPGGGGTLYTCRKCWEAQIPDGVTHRLVLQDDLLLCNDFPAIVNRMVNAQPNLIFSLFCPRVKPEDMKPETPYMIIKGVNAWGPGNLMPVKHIKPMFEFADKELGKDFPFDDGIYIWYARKNGLKIATTIPSLLQHLCPTESTLGYNNKNKVSKVWIGQDVSDYNWDTHFVGYTKPMGESMTLEKQKQMLEKGTVKKDPFTIFKKNNGNKFTGDME